MGMYGGGCGLLEGRGLPGVGVQRGEIGTTSNSIIA